VPFYVLIGRGKLILALQILFSTSLDRLADRLAAGLQDELRARTATDLFAPATIIVPNPNLAKWLRITIAEKSGAAVNLQFPYLEKGMWDLVRRAAGGAGAACRPLTPALLQPVIAACLLRHLRDDPNHSHDSPFTTYCQARTESESHDKTTFDPDSPDCVRRLWQLSSRLTMLFREYEYHRGPYSKTATRDRDMIGFWLENNPDVSYLQQKCGATLTSAQRRTEQSEHALYRQIFHPVDGILGALSPTHRYLSLPMLAREVFADNRSAATITPPTEHVHLFGLSQLSPFHCWLLYQLAAHVNLTLYHFNVCREFWEDTETRRERRWRLIREYGTAPDDDGGEQLDLTVENELLNAWGKAGRETIKLLADLDDDTGRCIVDWIDEEPGPATSVLTAMQHGVKFRTTPYGVLTHAA